MIDSIRRGGSFPPPPSSQQSLNSEQESLIEETLSVYDGDNLTPSDAASIVEAFSNAGISPGSAFAEKLASIGFSAREIGDLAGVGESERGQRPPPPPQSEQGQTGSLELSSVVDYLETLFEEKAAASSEDSDKQSTYAKFAERFGLAEGESLINIKV